MLLRLSAWRSKPAKSQAAKTAGLLDTLAAAYANAGRFQEAVKTGEEALSIAKAEGENDFADSIRARIALYKKGSPFRLPPTTNRH